MRSAHSIHMRHTHITLYVRASHADALAHLSKAGVYEFPFHRGEWSVNVDRMARFHAWEQPWIRFRRFGRCTSLIRIKCRSCFTPFVSDIAHRREFRRFHSIGLSVRMQRHMRFLHTHAYGRNAMRWALDIFYRSENKTRVKCISNTRLPASFDVWCVLVTGTLTPGMWLMLHSRPHVHNIFYAIQMYAWIEFNVHNISPRPGNDETGRQQWMLSYFIVCSCCAGVMYVLCKAQVNMTHTLCSIVCAYMRTCLNVFTSLHVCMHNYLMTVTLY